MLSLYIFILFATKVLSQETVLPIHYDISISLDYTELTFTSETTIAIFLEEPQAVLSLNSRNLTLKNVRVLNQKEEVSVLATNIDDTTGDVILQFETALVEGEYFVILETSGNINEEKKGFYYSNFIKDSVEYKIFLTNFRYDGARAVFPCFDNPKYISTFTLEIVRSKQDRAVTGFPLISTTEINNDTQKDTFARSDPIPTYLLSFAVGNFIVHNSTIYSFVDESTEFLSEISSKALEALKELYTYNVGKIYHVVVPDSVITTEVVENKGLIIYRESAVLYHEDRQSVEDGQTIAKIISHAVVNQKQESFTWNSNYWVTAGTTSVSQYELLQAIQPEWRLKEQFLVDELRDLLKRDKGDNAITLILPENQTPDAFTKDQILKSYSVVQMLTRLPFPGDVLENEENVIASAWTKKAGYPTVRTIGVRQTNQINFIQNEDIPRPIPISVAFNNAPNDFQTFDHTLENKEQRINFTNNAPFSWYLINPERLGYYRINYDPTNWETLAYFLLNPNNNINDFSAATRAILIEDVAYFANLGNLEYTLYLNFIQYLRRENDYIPLYSFIKTANEIKDRLSKTTTQAKFMSFATTLVSHIYENLGTSLLPSDTHINILSRINILTWLCDFGYSKCHEETDLLLSQNQHVHPNLQNLVYCGGMRTGNLQKFMFLKDQHVTHGHKRILKSMACTEENEVLTYILAATIDNTPVLTLQEEDKLDAYLAVLEGSDTGVDVTLAYTKQHLETFLDKFSEDVISQMFLALSKKLVTDAQLQMINDTFDCLTDEKKEQYKQLFVTVSQNILNNQNWQNSHVDVIEKWLTNNVVSTTPVPSTVKPTETEKPSTEPSTTTAGAGEIEISVALFVLLMCFVVLQ